MSTGSGHPRLLAGAVTLLLVGAGCGSSKHAAPASTRVPKGGTITVVGAYDPDGFNVKIPDRQGANLDVMASLWRGVWRTTPTSEFVLNTDLVTSAEMTSTDPQTVVYRINPQAVWSDGVPVSADDFVYNWQTARPGATDLYGSPVQSVGLPGGADPIASVTGSDGGKTVTVVWKDHNVQWKSGILFNYLIPAHVAAHVGFNTGFDRFDPAVEVSDGPFKIGSYNPGEDLTLVRNDRYWGAPARLDSIVFRFTTEDAAVSAFKTGEGDVVEGHAMPDVVAQLDRLPDVTTKITESLNQEYVGFSQRNELLALPEVRRAFALALDRRAIVDRVLAKGSTVRLAGSFLWANTQPDYRDTSGGRYDRPDVAGAKRLLEGVGFALGPDGVYAKDGKRLSFRARTLTEAPHDQELELVQAQVKEAGIELHIDDAPPQVVVPQLQRGDFDVEVLSYGKNPIGTSNQFRPGNRWAYADPVPNQLIVQSNTSSVTPSDWPSSPKPTRRSGTTCPSCPSTRHRSCSRCGTLTSTWSPTPEEEVRGRFGTSSVGPAGARDRCAASFFVGWRSRSRSCGGVGAGLRPGANAGDPLTELRDQPDVPEQTVAARRPAP